MSGNDHHFQPVDGLKLKCFCISSTGHAGQFVVQAKVILERNGGQRLVFSLNGDAFLCFNGLMQAFRPTTPRHGTTGEFINNHDLIVFDNVVDVFLVNGMCP